MAANLAGVALLVGALTTWSVGTVAAAPIATFGGSSTGIVFTGEMAANLGGTSTAVGNLRDALEGAIFGVVPSAPVATFGGVSAGIVFDGRMASTLSGTGALVGTITTTNIGLVGSAPIATFGGTAEGIVTDGSIGNILPTPIATFGGSATGYSYDPRVWGHGTGRTHLLLGQVALTSPPTESAGDLYVLTDGYGNSEGAPTTLVLETPDIAPLGELGRLRVRLASLTIQHATSCSVQVTPIVDYTTELAPVTASLVATGRVTRSVIQVRMMRVVTVLRFRIEVTGAAGGVEIYTPILYYAPLAERSSVAMGEAP